MEPPAPGKREPKPLHMSLRQHHCRIEANDRELPRDVQNRLDDVLANLMFGVVELGGVVPGKSGAVVAVVYIARRPVTMVPQAK